jgi:hypothetical protein
METITLNYKLPAPPYLENGGLTKMKFFIKKTRATVLCI